MQHHGLDNEITIAEADFSEDSGYRGTASLLRRSEAVTAIVAVNDLAAIGALSAAQDSGMTVPDDLAITGYDDTFVAAIRQVSLTSINPDSTGIGALAARRLVQRIEDRDAAVAEHLFPRGSSPGRAPRRRCPAENPDERSRRTGARGPRLLSLLA